MQTKNISQLKRWRDATLRYNARQTIKTFWNEVNKDREVPISPRQQEHIQRMLIESIGSARSINEIQNNLIQQGIPISRYHIERLLLNIGTLASVILEHFDSMIGPMIHVIEADETFHGDCTMFFEAVDHRTGYVLALKMIPDAKAHTLFPHYEELLTRFPQISALITDLATAYPKTIEQLRKKQNKELIHIKCQVHALRTIYKKIAPLKRNYSKICRTIETLKSTLQTLHTNLRKHKKSIYYYQKRYRDLTIERDRLRILYNVKRYSKNMGTKYPQLKTVNMKINNVRSMIRGKKASIRKSETKILDCESRLASETKEKMRYWNIYMSQLKMKSNFVSYCKHRINTLQEFLKKIRGFKQKPCREFKKTLMKIVQGHPELLSLHHYLDEKESLVRLISTNKIESFNNILRRYKDIRRVWKDTELTTAYLTILRLYMNFRRALRSKGEGSSPIEKFGVDLKGKSLYDLLFVRTEVNIFDLTSFDFELSLSGGRTLSVIL